mmetsp:Transcript_36664/g.117615  ORF Transcript_36664/g.117615 Transcript_36664/m.117615 type:complete len:113 (+) Transcript_36664:1430-1768(+)
MAGKDKGLTTEAFIQKVGWRLGRYLAEQIDFDDGIVPDPKSAKPSVLLRRNAQKIDLQKVEALFNEFDADRNGSISLAEFEEMMIKLGLAPLKEDADIADSRTKVQEKTTKV